MNFQMLTISDLTDLNRKTGLQKVMNHMEFKNVDKCVKKTSSSAQIFLQHN